MRYEHGVTPEALRLLLGGFRHDEKPSRYPARKLSARPLTLSDDTRVRGGKKSRRRVARVWR